MEWVAEVPYEGQGPEEWVTHVDNPVDPGCYEYSVTAIYDLSPYGFPGETGESMHEGPDTACVVWGNTLPFMETWDNGGFDFNGWRTGAFNNWVVNSQIGNPAPAAQFNWDPNPGPGYNVPLTSAPLNADVYTEGDIWFDFEYMLSNRIDTVTEKLVVEVYNGQSWMQVAEFMSGSNTGWTFQHLKITEYAMGRVFMVRFAAMGENAFHIIYWGVDNIHIYRMCEAPTDLDGMYDGDGPNNDGEQFGAQIYWTQPYIPEPPSGWIRWDDGVNFSGIGLTDGGEFSVAARWDAGQLAMYVGASITRMQFFPNDDGFETITMKIWTGPNATTLVYEAVADAPVVGAWNEYTIDPPVALDVNDELWIGYTVSGQPQGAFPAGTDAGPAVAGYGDKITTDGVNWDNMSDLGVDNNWNVAAYVETLNGQIEQIGGSLVDHAEYNNVSNSISRDVVKSEGIAFEQTDATRAFMGFNIYRMGPGESTYSFLEFVEWVDGTPDYSYYDDDPFGGEAQYPYEVCYQVTAVWESETDYCESAPALSLIPLYDYVCIMVTSVEDPLAGEVTNLYPNPATDRATVSSSQTISHLTVVNYIGQVVYDSEIGDLNKVELNTSSYDAGVYIVRISTESGIVTKRLTVAK
jgi:hypothetical protein